MKKKLLIFIISLLSYIPLLYASATIKENKKDVNVVQNIEALSISESTDNPCKASGGICYNAPNPTIGIHIAVD